MARIVLFLLALFPLMSFACNPALTQEECWANAVNGYLLQEQWTNMMPIPNDLDLKEGPSQITEVLRVIDADWQSIAPPNYNAPQASTAVTGPRARVSFSPGLRVGKDPNGYDIWAWKVTPCNQQPVALELDAGDLQSAAASAGISYVDEDDAQIANSLSRNKSGPIVGSQAIQGGAGLVTGLLAMKLIAASSIWGAVGFGVTYGASALTSYFKSVSPPDFATKFAGQEVLLDNTSFGLAPVGQSGHCTTKVIFSRTKKGAAPISGVVIP